MRKYVEYKDSGIKWIGEVPKHWSDKRLKEIASIFGGKDYKEVICDNGKYEVYGSGGAFEKASKYLYNRESVLLGRKGTIDKPLYVDKPFWVVDTMYYTKIPKFTCGKYFYYLSTCIEFRFYKYGSALPSMTQGDLNRIIFFVPPLQEQQAIANYLDEKTQAIDKKVSLLEQKIETYKKLKRTLINQTITKGLDKNAPLKDSGISWIGQIPQHWEVKRFKDVVKIVNGYAFKSNDFSDEGISVLRISDITKSDFSDLKKVPTFYKTLAKESKVLKGDILMAMTGATIGKNAFFNVDDILYLNQRVCSFRSINKNHLLPLYFSLYISSDFVQNLIRLISSGSAQENISKSQLEVFEIVVPPKSEQEEIAKYLDHKTTTIDAIVSNIGKQIDTLKQLRKTLINDVVTGKIKVCDD